MKLTSLPVACLALAGTALAVPASSKAALANHDLRSTITVHESAATTTVYSTVYSTRKPAMSTEGCTPVTVTVTYSMHLLEGPTSTLRATPTHLPGSIMKHLDGLPSTYKHCFHVEEENAREVSDYHHLKYTWPVTTWCQGGKYLQNNGGRSFASWLDTNIVPCVRTYSGEPSTADRMEVRDWIEFHCGAKGYRD